MSIATQNKTSDVNKAAHAAHTAFFAFKNTSSEQRISFLLAIAAEMEKNKTAIVEAAHKEANLPFPRLDIEFNRTINQIKLFSRVISEEHWKDISIDVKRDNNNVITVDLRRINMAIGPVAVFGASNFPLAYSVAGGDTISALAAACPVVVKAHNAHVETSRLVADCILEAGRKTNMPEGFFSIIYDEGFTAGIELVKHPHIKAVGFTGSYNGGKALMDAASTRQEPIPVYAEMGSLNPVVLLPEELKQQTEKWAKTFAASITAGCGQFCTKPGLFFAIEGEALQQFILQLKKELSAITVHPMLNEHIKNSFISKLEKHIVHHAATDYTVTAPAAENVAQSIYTSIASVTAADFIADSSLREEYFGPFALIIRCKNAEELEKALSSLGGQLTATLVGSTKELSHYASLIELLKNKTGRILFNAVPTGVEVCHSINHGGPFPASSTPLFSSVGADAIKRFVRPLCYQNWPQSELPAELKNENPKKILRRINGTFTTDSISE